MYIYICIYIYVNSYIYIHMVSIWVALQEPRKTETRPSRPEFVNFHPSGLEAQRELLGQTATTWNQNSWLMVHPKRNVFLVLIHHPCHVLGLLKPRMLRGSLVLFQIQDMGIRSKYVFPAGISRFREQQNT